MEIQMIRRISSPVFMFFALVILSAFLCTRYFGSFETISFGRNSPQQSLIGTEPLQTTPPEPMHIPLNCSIVAGTCPAGYYPSIVPSPPRDLPETPPPATCPDYFRWIHEDLWHWRETGITPEMVASAQQTADFRLVVIGGKAYVETYRKSYQTRDTFTLWGILQLLRKYPGKLPDLDLMFNCGDDTLLRKGSFNGRAPPPLFRYCGSEGTVDVVFPDWSFWGWPEINIKPWEVLSEGLEKGNKNMKWIDRELHAYWKGNPTVAKTRKDLLRCNVSEKQDWNARLFAQDWIREQKQGYKSSYLANQCMHRYKIYIEGRSWSVSEKYILACDSVTLLVKPHFYDFFTRSLVPLKHYWPIKDGDKCRSIKYAVDWGNSHQQEAQAMGKEASRFIHNDLKMDYVYDYMFHLLSEYAKLLTYKPTIPEKAVELCSESMACFARGLEKQFMMESLATGPKVSEACVLPPPYDAASLRSIIGRRDGGIQQVESWEGEYWKSRDNKQM